MRYDSQATGSGRQQRRLHEPCVARPDHRKTLEFCENGAKALTWEATPITIPTSFGAEHSTTDMFAESEYWLGM